MKLILTFILAFVVLSSSAWAADLSDLAPDASEEHIFRNLIVNVASGKSLSYRSKSKRQILKVRSGRSHRDDINVSMKNVKIKVDGQPSVQVKTKSDNDGFWNIF